MRKYRKTRSIFDDGNQQINDDTEPATRSSTSKYRKSKHESQTSNSSYASNSNPDSNSQYEQPFISTSNDSIHLTSENYKPNQALIDITGFSNLSPFINTSDKSHSLDSLHDNAYSDYNETGQNNINDSDYRRRLIKQMQDSVFQQSRSMFGTIERTTKNNQYQVDSHYTPSNASAAYLQRQSKQMFNAHRSTIFRDD